MTVENFGYMSAAKFITTTLSPYIYTQELFVQFISILKSQTEASTWMYKQFLCHYMLHSIISKLQK